ncbi:hypothetical protein BAG01nite_21350 [Brevibacillus agri]|uniref:Uncharacterized protein n=1 Tax=Brevibacillus agri TaxID=51101 RepID=A0A3M8B187_9BACL|nr:hypothetical protein [Brevibacillus agri]MCG5251128.1 hypothetical protein [Brevibacillus agri]MDN4093330.1 hypothetical protein [Brevibacillus agri]MDR9504941.1 hypothetical protein [Brevibacillus agri]MED1644349.1 hypothetical protein [Brevibacillus agri]MED1656393.1 hypothetical protein [Brevibacillus agri]
MDENRWLANLKDRADQTAFRDVRFTEAMKDQVRTRISREARRSGWKRLAMPATVLVLGFLIWTALPLPQPAEHAAHPQPPVPELLPGGQLLAPDLWKPMPLISATYEQQSFSYVGEKPVRAMTDPDGLYEGQTQRFIWLLNASELSRVELVAYSSAGKRIELGSYQVMGPLHDASGHFPSGIALPDPGVWKLQVLSQGKQLGHVFVEVKKGISPANRELVEPIVRSYLETEETKLGWLPNDREVSLELLGVEAPNAERRVVYAWVKVLSKNPAHSSGVSAPMVFYLAYDGQTYRVQDMQMPEDGSRYNSSLQKLFPPNVLEQIRYRE